MQASTRAEGMQRALGIDALDQPVLCYKTAVWGAKPHMCNCKERKVVFSLGCRPALEQKACRGP